MKHCPECNKNYADPTLSYCLDDGAPLIFGAAVDEPPTAVLTDELRGETPTRQYRPESSAWAGTGKQEKTGQPRVTALTRRRLWMMALPVALLLGGFLIFYEYSRPTGESPIDSIAVLPFVNASDDANTEYLSEGIADSIANSLSEIPSLRVVPLSKVSRYKNRDVDPQDVGKELGVRAVLVGRVVQRADGLNIRGE